MKADPSGSPRPLDFAPETVADLLGRGVESGAFPGAVAYWGSPLTPPRRALAGLRGRTRDAVPVTFDLIYDLASVTKILATTSLALLYVQRGRLDLNQPLAESPLARGPLSGRAPGRPWSIITPACLLAHQSGLEAWRPFYRLAGHEGAAPAPVERRRATLEAIWSDPPPEAAALPPGRRTVYSDLNFILLGFLLETVGDAPLDELFRREIAAPLGLAAIGFRPRSRPLAPTEDGFRWGGPVGHPDALFQGPVPLGQPHDDNARWLGGVAGHAGLFAPADDVWALAEDWARAWTEGRGRLFDRATLAEFLRPRPTAEDEGRPLGFNQRKNVASLAASPLSPEAVGHLGYTGPALWWEPERDFLWLFLTNRVHPRTTNLAWSPGLFQGGPGK